MSIVPWGPHRAAALEAEIDLGGIGMAMIGARLTWFPTGNCDVAFADPAEHSFHMLLGIESLLGLEVENLHLPLRELLSSLILERDYGRKR